jgi:hypothetical protein
MASKAKVKAKTKDPKEKDPKVKEEAPEKEGARAIAVVNSASKDWGNSKDCP